MFVCVCVFARAFFPSSRKWSMGYDLMRWEIYEWSLKLHEYALHEPECNAHCVTHLCYRLCSLLIPANGQRRLCCVSVFRFNIQMRLIMADVATMDECTARMALMFSACNAGLVYRLSAHSHNGKSSNYIMRCWFGAGNNRRACARTCDSVTDVVDRFLLWK